MTQQSNPAHMLSWWEEINFPEKESYHLTDDGTLMQRAIGAHKERSIATLTSDNADIVLNALKEKFAEVMQKVDEVRAEWSSTEDKLKLNGKVERLKEYLSHTNAVGNFQALLQQIDEWEKILSGLTEENYKAKQQLAVQAEQLMNSESWKETTQAFKDIVEQWKHIGYVPRSQNDALWNRIEEARNVFYGRKRTHQEQHEKDLLQNLDLKMELVEKAENLAASEDWKHSTEVFRQLMEEWKTIGRTVADKNEELWNRFITAKNVFYDRKKVHFENIQQEQEANMQLKEALIARAESMKDSTEWNVTTQAYADLMEEWKNVGRVPLEKAEEMWNRLNAAKEVFFQAKRHHFETMRISLEDNYAQKLALLKRAETLKGSTHWREASQEMNELMDEWKKVGAVPREHSNAIWEQFLTARKYFFERKDANREHRKKQAEKHFSARTEQTRQFLQKLHDEIKEEEEKLVDFREGLGNITTGRKEAELRTHLESLISQGETRIARKREKIVEVEKELDEMLNKSSQSDTPKDVPQTDSEE